MSGQIQLGIVGLGTIARGAHLPAISRVPEFELSAVASRHADVPELRCYRDVQSMLVAEADLHAVSLCTPPQGRFEQALSVLMSGRHLMLEKPPACSVTEVAMLATLARQRGVSLFTTWHSRMAAAVQHARTWLSSAVVRSVEIAWEEDVHFFHPGQTWIWEPGGLGVFDPGINALSILTEILPGEARVVSAELEIPVDCQMPIRARVEMTTSAGAPMLAVFDWQRKDAPRWDILVETDRGRLLLRDGGATLLIDDQVHTRGTNQEYLRLYQRFAQLIAGGESDVDVRPMQLAADAFLIGSRRPVAGLGLRDGSVQEHSRA